MNEIDKLLDALGRGVASLDATAEARAWERLAARIEQNAGGAHVAGTRRGRPRWVVLVPIAASITLVVLVASALLPARFGGPAAADAALHSLAAIARVQTSPTIPPGSYLFLSDRQMTIGAGSSFDGGAWSYRVASTRTAWLAADGSGRIVTTYGAPTFLEAADESAWVQAGSPPLVPSEPEVEDFGARAFPVIDGAALSDDPERLMQQLRAGAGGQSVDGPGETFDLVGELLAEQLVPPSTRGALFEVAATVPGVEALGTVEDPLGRSGIGIRLNSGGSSTTLIFDATTSALLAQLDTRPIDGVPRTQWRAFEPTSIVDEIDQPVQG